MSLLRQLLIIVCLIGLGGAAWWFGLRGEAEETTGANAGRVAQETPVEVALVRTGEVRETIEALGTARARQSIELVPNATGRVVEILFETGETVEAGQPLLRLDDSIERANLEEARAVMEDPRRQLERARQLLVGGNVSQARVDELEKTYTAALARYRVARQRLEERVVTAPFTGVVGFREVDVGARLSETTVITRLEDISLMELQFQVPEVFFSRIRTGQSVQAVSSALPGQVFTGEIAAVDYRIDEVSRAFQVRATLPNPDGAIPAGLFMLVRIVIETRADALLVPEEAIVPENGRTYVFRIEDGKARRVSVQTGQRRDGEVEVIRGLAPGDMIVTAGVQRLRDGAFVRILNPPPADAPTHEDFLSKGDAAGNGGPEDAGADTGHAPESPESPESSAGAAG